MVVGAYGDAHLVDEGAEVVVMDAFEVERDGGGAGLRSVEDDAGELPALKK